MSNMSFKKRLLYCFCPFVVSFILVIVGFKFFGNEAHQQQIFITNIPIINSEI